MASRAAGAHFGWRDAAFRADLARLADRNLALDVLGAESLPAAAEAAGVSYEQYMLELLDTGRHLQAGDRKRT